MNLKIILVLITANYLLTVSCNLFQNEQKVTQFAKENFNRNQRLHSKSVNIWIYLKDKPQEDAESYKRAANKLHDDFHSRALTRRAKMNRSALDTTELITTEDFPVDQSYIQTILATCNEKCRIRSSSVWFNAVSLQLSNWEEEIPRLLALECVNAIDTVISFKKQYSQHEEEIVLSENTKRNDNSNLSHLNYGNAFTQLNQISADQVHKTFNNAGEGVRILVLDSGFFLSHECFENLSVIAKHDFVNNVTDNVGWQPGETFNQIAHGTSVLSTIACAVDGKLYGPAFQSEYILGKTESLSFELQIEEDWFVEALEWGEKLGADIVSASLGYTDWYEWDQMDGKTALITRAINFAVKEKGMIAVISNGNSGNEGVIPPADSPYAISVGAVNSDSRIVAFSSRGPNADGVIKPDVVALGRNTHCADFRNSFSYRTMSGTSFAAPLITGIVAQILSAHPDWTPGEVKQALLTTASQSTSPNNNYGWGIANATAAIGATVSVCPNNCNERGPCINSMCSCDKEYFGYDCSFVKMKCAERCHHGSCIDGVCICNDGWEGIACNVLIFSSGYQLRSPIFNLIYLFVLLIFV